MSKRCEGEQSGQRLIANNDFVNTVGQFRFTLYDLFAFATIGFPQQGLLASSGSR